MPFAAEGLPKVAGFALHLLEKPNIFDGNHRLIGEGRDEFDLLVREPFNDLATEEQHSDDLLRPKQGNAEQCHDSRRLSADQDTSIRDPPERPDLHGFAGQQYPSDQAAASRMDTEAIQHLGPFG